MKKACRIFIVFGLVCLLIGCKQTTKNESPAEPSAQEEQTVKTDIRNIFAINNIQSCEVTGSEINPDGSEKETKIIKNIDYDRDGNIVKEIDLNIKRTTTNSYRDALIREQVITDNKDESVLVTTKYMYKDNQTIESLFDEKGKLSLIQTTYKDQQGRDTLALYANSDNKVLYKSMKKYDNIGLKETIVDMGDGNVTYYKRVNDDKLKQITESTDANGSLCSRQTRTYDNNGNETESLYEDTRNLQTFSADHLKKFYNEKGLLDYVLFLDSNGNPVKKESYKYTTF